ncbi:hypothetical protein [Pseudomonas sp. NPDC096950]|uniref:hypothetical protein n=1 Tax=Pseudomonas sp. NPDC096950 TaxID=3364485 RepID=UPI00383B88F7
MQMHEAGQVLEVFNQDEANERLAEDWRLLAVLPGAPRGSSNSTSVIYVLGKPKEKTGTGLYGQPV